MLSYIQVITSLFLALYMCSIPAFGQTSQAKGSFDQDIQQARILLNQKKYQEVIALLDPKRIELPRTGLLVLAVAFHKKENYLEEIRVLRFLVSKNEVENDAYSLHELGKAYEANNDHVKAVENYRYAIDARPTSRRAFDSLLALHLKLNSNYEAQVLLDEMMRRFGRKPEFLNEQCRLYSLGKFFEKAKDICTEAINSTPILPDNHVYLALTFKNQGLVNQARRIIRKTAKQFPKSSLAQIKAGKFHIEEGNYKAALSYFKKARRVDSSSMPAHLLTATTAFELEKYDLALEAFIEACRIDRASLHDFRTAESKLKIKRQTALQIKYADGIGQCFVKKKAQAQN